MQQTRKIFLIALLFLTGFLLTLVLLKKSQDQPWQQNTASIPVAEVDGLPDICRYWQPWTVALAPHRPSDLMAIIVDRSRNRAARTNRFEAWAAAGPRRSEHVCAAGKNIENIFTLDLVHMDQPSDLCNPTENPLDFSMVMHVERSEHSRNLNSFVFTLATSTLSASRLRTLIASQLQLLHQGYPAWQSAFPDFSNEDTTGIGIGHIATEKADGVAELTSNIAWNPQRFWERVPVLATWLLNLGALVNLETTVTDGQGLILADITTSTGSLGTSARFPLAEKGLIPGYFTDKTHTGALITPASNFRLIVKHKVSIGFKGLSIIVHDLEFQGDIAQTVDRLTYTGKFAGSGPIEVSGDYKGLAALGMGDMIRKMIKEAIEKEVKHLTEGNNGKGWLITATLGPAAAAPGKSEFKLAMEFESPIHITEIMRFESASESGPVLPNRAASYEFRNYSDEILTALWRDSQRFRCFQP